MRLELKCLFVVGVLSLARATPVHNRSDNGIDGKSVTVANVITDYLLGLIPNDNIALLIRMIIDAFNQPEFDYWGNVKEEVEGLVGSYIDEHNMHQVEIYQKDLQELMQRYSDAPVSSATYPDKNLQASALSTSIISHRYLTEASERPESMILHFEDFASIHVVVLKDVAETYSPADGPLSRWWVDLDQELDHYIQYEEQLRTQLSDWRMNQLTCRVNIAGSSCTTWEWAGRICYDDYIAEDAVTGEVSQCRQLHGTTSCQDHCSLFQQYKQQDLEVFLRAKVNDVLDAWKNLKEISSENAAHASKFYNPIERK